MSNWPLAELISGAINWLKAVPAFKLPVMAVIAFFCYRRCNTATNYGTCKHGKIKPFRLLNHFKGRNYWLHKSVENEGVNTRKGDLGGTCNTNTGKKNAK